ncbi:MAG: ABC-type heme export system ATPase component CcmA [Idiomarinaceae bacterium HL-53]|nr:MAG: ABC-type heme export system ATPase component CcmA [Idiomarinaceae bacterium HL-53]CUS47162.1 heme exporter protein A [Idiomarinaceae bacterium HL-53]
MSDILSAQQLTSVRGERTLFRDLNLQLHAGELCQVQGPNGAGKSTLLRICAGLLQPQAGEVRYEQRLLAEVRSEYHQNLLFIGHKAGVKPELTAIENLEFFAAVQGQTFTQTPYALLAKVGLVGLEDIPAQQLSAGQQRRIALARLWCNQAKLWILDEPFTSLDVDGIQLLHGQFEAHLEAGGSILLTSHQPLNTLRGNVSNLVLEYQH